VVKDNILWVTDLISPRGPITRNPQTLAVGEALRKHNITGALIAGGHGTTARRTSCSDRPQKTADPRVGSFSTVVHDRG
jgi:hypothetical protein